jgi:hypothetical protein
MHMGYLIAYCDGRIDEAAVSGHSNLDWNRFGYKVSNPIGDLSHHDSKTDCEQKNPQNSTTPFTMFNISGSP